MKTAGQKLHEAVEDWESRLLSSAELVWIVAKIAAAVERNEIRQTKKG